MSFVPFYIWPTRNKMPDFYMKYEGNGREYCLRGIFNILLVKDCRKWPEANFLDSSVYYFVA